MVVFKINIKRHKGILRGGKIKFIFPFRWQETQNITWDNFLSLKGQIELQFPLPHLNALQAAIGLLVKPWDDHEYEIKKIESEENNVVHLKKPEKYTIQPKFSMLRINP